MTSAQITPLLYFTVGDWKTKRDTFVEQIAASLQAPWIVRSSCQQEDGEHEPNAGAFLSILHVTSDILVESIDKVIHSYGHDNPKDEMLIQPMLRNVIRSSVAFSHDPSTCSPFRIINWAEGDDTEAITSGIGGRTWQQAAYSPLTPPLAIAGVIVLLEELLNIFDGKPVDCEFAVTESNGTETLWLLQARPLILQRQAESIASQTANLKCIQERVAIGMRPHPFLLGKRSVYGVMPDWNPAEIIGTRPKPLALSLYRELVTDSIWAYQRHNYGYRNLRSFPLMPHFLGLPYIDVRVSFNSFIPADLEDGLAGRLVDHYIDCLLAEPKLHDKLEFEIVYSCFTLDLPERIQLLSNKGFSKDEQQRLSNSLRDLTNRIIDPHHGLWKQDAAKLDKLRERRRELLASDTTSLERIYWLLEDVKRYGTLPFAGLARAGFIAIQMLQEAEPP